MEVGSDSYLTIYQTLNLTSAEDMPKVYSVYSRRCGICTGELIFHSNVNGMNINMVKYYSCNL